MAVHFGTVVVSDGKYSGVVDDLEEDEDMIFSSSSW